MKTIIRAVALIAVVSASTGCLDNFEDYNRNPNEATDDELERDNYLVGSKLTKLQNMVIPSEEHLYQFVEALEGGSYGGYGGSYGGAGYGNAGYGTGASRLQRVRAAITQGNLNLAEELLNAQTDHDAEWNYLKGAICTRRGWLDEARRYYQTAVQMAPDNAEYQRALDMAEGRQNAYRPNGYGSVTTGSCDNNDCLRLCGISLCCNALGVPVCFC